MTLALSFAKAEPIFVTARRTASAIFPLKNRDINRVTCRKRVQQKIPGQLMQSLIGKQILLREKKLGKIRGVWLNASTIL
jgi:hypothetical protein